MIKYIPASISVLSLETASQLLTGSVTKVPVSVQNVAVAPMEDGFEDQGGFQDISFD